jgi:hypothetical protein
LALTFENKPAIKGEEADVPLTLNNDDDDDDDHVFLDYSMERGFI